MSERGSFPLQQECKTAEQVDRLLVVQVVPLQNSPGGSLFLVASMTTSSTLTTLADMCEH